MAEETDLDRRAALYVPASERAAAMSLGAVLLEGDARLHMPHPLPPGVVASTFERWMTSTAKLVWIGEMLEDVLGGSVDLLDLAGIVHMAAAPEDDEEHLVPLFVPQCEMDIARRIPGVSWDRRRRQYVADASADFGLVHRFLTPAMKAAWITDRNLDTAMSAMMRSQAMIATKDEGAQRDPLELIPRQSEKAPD